MKYTDEQLRIMVSNLRAMGGTSGRAADAIEQLMRERDHWRQVADTRKRNHEGIVADLSRKLVEAGDKCAAKITFADAVSSERVVSAPGAAIKATEFALSDRGRAALSGQAHAAPTLSPSDSAHGACGGDPDEQAVPRDPMGMTDEEAAGELADQDEKDEVL